MTSTPTHYTSLSSSSRMGSRLNQHLIFPSFQTLSQTRWTSWTRLQPSAQGQCTSWSLQCLETATPPSFRARTIPAHQTPLPVSTLPPRILPPYYYNYVQKKLSELTFEDCCSFDPDKCTHFCALLANPYCHRVDGQLHSGHCSCDKRSWCLVRQHVV